MCPALYCVVMCPVLYSVLMCYVLYCVLLCTFLYCVLLCRVLYCVFNVSCPLLCSNVSCPLLCFAVSCPLLCIPSHYVCVWLWLGRVGKNLVLTCRAQVPNPDLVRELRWFHPSGNQIRQDERYVPRVPMWRKIH